MSSSSAEAVTLAATCFGVSLGVTCRSVDVPAVSAHLPIDCEPASPGEVEHRFVLEFDGGAGDRFSVRHGSSLKAVAQPLNGALKILQKEIHLCVAENARSHVFVHAGVVACNNRAIILPGFSHAGKSTLVWSLVQAGAVYFSDEYAVFDENGYVHPFALPIGLRSLDGGRRTIMPHRVGSGSLLPGIIAFARYRPSAIWHPRELGPAEAVLQLIRHSIAIRSNPALVLPVLKNISLRAQAFAGKRGEPAQLVQWISTKLQELGN